MTDYRPDNLERVEPLYLKQYGLHSAPFAPTHEDRFLYLDTTRHEKLNLLAHMVQYSNLLLILIGETGSGKTSLLQRFITMAQPEWRICQLTANTMMDADQLLFGVAQGFGLQQLPQNPQQLQEMLYARLAALQRQEQTPILIIDEAHALPKEALLALFQLADTQVEQGGLIRIILSSAPSIEKILQTKELRALRERITHTMELTPFDEAGTAEYLKHRLAVAGLGGISPFNPKIVKKIYHDSNGMPAGINEQAHLFLERGEQTVAEVAAVLPPPPTPTSRGSHRAIIWITLGAFTIIGVLVYQDQINSWFNPPAAPVATEVTAVTTPSLTPIPQQKIIPLTPEVTASMTVTPSVVSQASITPSPSKTANVVATTPEPLPAITVDIRSLEPATLPLSKQSQMLTINGQGFSPDSQVTIGWSAKSKTLPASQVKYINANELHVTITTGSKADTWFVQVSDPQHGKTKRVEFAVGQAAKISEPPSTSSGVSGSQDETWVRAQPTAHFTLQLFSSNTLPGAKKFIQQHKLQNHSALIHSIIKGKHWYSVLHGSYASETEAAKGIKQLSATLQKNKPWIRRFDSIQANLSATVSTKPTTMTTIKTDAPTKPVTIAKPTTAAGAPASTQQEAWLWSQDPRHVTLQLLVSQQQDNAERFIKKYEILHTKSAYFRSTRNGRELFTVVWGDFATRGEADAAIKQLPAELRQVKPRVRTYATIHAEMKKP